MNKANVKVFFCAHIVRDMTSTDNFNAFMAPEKMREDSATIAEETSMFGQRQSYISPSNINHVKETEDSSDNNEEDNDDNFDEDLESRYSDQSNDDNASISSKISRFSVQATKVKVPKFKDKWTGYQWCRRQTKIIEKMTGKKIERKIQYGDDPNEFAFYLKCQEQDAYVDSTCKWLTQMLIGVCGGMESASRFLRKYVKTAPNFDGLTDNNMAVLDEYEVLFMQMDESVGERFRQIDPMWRVCFIFLFQLVSTAAVNYGTKAMMGGSQGANPLGALGLDTTNIQSMAQNMSDSVLKGLDGNTTTGDVPDMATMMQGMMKNIMPMMQNMMTGMEPKQADRQKQTQQQQQVINLADAGQTEEEDNLPLLQTIAENKSEENEQESQQHASDNDVDDDDDDFEIKETAGQSSHTVDLNEFE